MEKSLEEVIEKKELCYLALGELGFGTKAYDPLAMDGLALFLKANDYAKKISNILLDSGIMPLIPEWYGVTNAENMRFLGNDPNKKPNKKAKGMLDSEELKDEDKEYIKKYVLQKITSKSEAVAFARSELEKLTAVLKNVTIDYIHGEEDKENIKVLEELKINDYTKGKKARQKDLESKIEESKKELEKLKHGLETVKQEKNILQGARSYLRGKDPKKHPQYFKKLQEKLTLKPVSNIKELKEYLKSIQEEIGQKNQEIKQNRDLIRDQEINLNAIEREKELYIGIQKRRQIKADVEEILFRLAKKEYNDLLYHIVEGKKFHIHSSWEKDLEIKGSLFALAHSQNFRSNDTTRRELAQGKLRNNLENKLGKEVPDVRISAHGADGFKFQTQAKKTEDTIKGHERETPELVLNIQLPTFQSTEALEICRQKGLKNWAVKRYEQGRYCSGAVLHTLSPNGKHTLEFISINELIKFGRIAKELEQYKNELNKAEGDKRKKIKESITILEAKLIPNPRKLEALSDTHLGCPNEPGRPSNYDFIEAAQAYQRENGLPKYLVLNGDIMHGALEFFGSNEQYLAPTPKQIEKEKKRIKADKNLSLEQKLGQIEKIDKVAREAVPITNVSKQKIEIKERIIPYVLEVLENKGKVIIVSGNHYNKSTKKFDEATDIASMLPQRYLDNGQVVIFEGLGDSYGSGTTLLEGDEKLYASHKPGSGVDEISAASDHILKANIDANTIIFGDRHHPGGGFADESAYIACAGMEPWNKYVDKIKKYPGNRGIINYYFDPEKKGYRRWELVFDPVLEKKM